MHVRHKYRSDCCENLYSSSSDLAEQLTLNKESRFHLSKVVKLCSEIIQKKKRNLEINVL